MVASCAADVLMRLWWSTAGISEQVRRVFVEEIDFVFEAVRVRGGVLRRFSVGVGF